MYYNIVFVGRLAKEKNPELLILAIKELRLNRSRIRLHFIGDGPLAIKMKKAVIALNLNDVVIFHGEQNPAKYYEIANLVVIPSLQEAFSLVMIEASVNQIDFLASAQVPVTEVLDEKLETFAPHDHKTLARLIQMKIDKSASSQILKRRRQHVLKMYSLEHIVSRWITVYHQCIGGPT